MTNLLSLNLTEKAQQLGKAHSGFGRNRKAVNGLKETCFLE
jgi:hypothetical protein